MKDLLWFVGGFVVGMFVAPFTFLVLFLITAGKVNKKL